MDSRGLAADMAGRGLRSARRVRYVFEGRVIDENGPLELTFEDGLCVQMDAGANGFTLRVERGPWIDPLRQPLSAENAEFVEQYGKWTAFDVDKGSDVGIFYGSRLVNVVELPDDRGYLVGLFLVFSNGALIVTVGADELHVRVEQSGPSPD